MDNLDSMYYAEQLEMNLALSSDQALSPAAEGTPAVPERYPNLSRPAQSAHPGSRPKRTEAEKSILEQIKGLAPRAVEMLETIIAPDSKASPYVKLQAIDMILNRTLGKPEASVKLTTAAQSVEASEARIAAMISRIRIEASNE